MSLPIAFYFSLNITVSDIVVYIFQYCVCEYLAMRVQVCFHVSRDKHACMYIQMHKPTHLCTHLLYHVRVSLYISRVKSGTRILLETHDMIFVLISRALRLGYTEVSLDCVMYLEIYRCNDNSGLHCVIF